MISRVAEHCYWMSRYLERAENTARVLEVNHTLLLDFHVPFEQQWRPVLIISGIDDYDHEAKAENVQDYMTWDEENPASIVSSLSNSRENARIIREVISAEMWERTNFYHLWLHSPTARALYATNRNEFYAQIRRINQLIHGIADGTMSHGEPWEFFRLGMYLERACQTARILDVKYHMLLPTIEDVGTPVDSAHWMAILMSCSGYEPFHKRSTLATADPGNAVADFLIFDKEFPRSIVWCLREMRQAAAAISGVPIKNGPANDAEQLTDDLIAWLERSTIRDLIREGLHESLTKVVDTAQEIAVRFSKTYFDVSFEALTQAVEERQNQVRAEAESALAEAANQSA